MPGILDEIASLFGGPNRGTFQAGSRPMPPGSEAAKLAPVTREDSLFQDFLDMFPEEQTAGFTEGGNKIDRMMQLMGELRERAPDRALLRTLQKAGGQ